MINDTDGQVAWLVVTEMFGGEGTSESIQNYMPDFPERSIEGRFLTLTEIAEINARQAEEVREALNEKPTPAQLNDACMSYRHDFGLLAKDDADQTMGEALDWWTAIVRALKRG